MLSVIGNEKAPQMRQGRSHLSGNSGAAAISNRQDARRHAIGSPATTAGMCGASPEVAPAI
jgi:hypothetical protein